MGTPSVPTGGIRSKSHEIFFEFRPFFDFFTTKRYTKMGITPMGDVRRMKFFVWYTTTIRVVYTKFEQNLTTSKFKFRSDRILFKLIINYTYGSSISHKKFQPSDVIHSWVMPILVYRLVVKKSKNGRNSKLTSWLLGPIPPVGTLGVSTTQWHRPFFLISLNPILYDFGSQWASEGIEKISNSYLSRGVQPRKLRGGRTLWPSWAQY